MNLVYLIQRKKIGKALKVYDQAAEETLDGSRLFA